MSYPGNTTGGAKVQFGDSPNIDAFSRLRVSQPHILLSSVMDTDERADLWSTKLTGGGSITYRPNERAVALTVGTASGDKVERQTLEYLTYRPGNSQIILMTYVMGVDKANLRQRMGYFDAQNGLFFSCENEVMYVCLRSFVTGSTVDARYGQSDWNLDTLDGTGDGNNPSGILFKPTKAQILVIDFQWLGSGRVRYGFDIDGVIVYIHELYNANCDFETVYMTTGSLPCRYEIENLGVTASPSTLLQICSSVLREGATEEPGHATTVGLTLAEMALTAITTTELTVLGIRLKAAQARTVIKVLAAKLTNVGTNPVLMRVLLNPTLGSAAVWADDDGHPIQKSVTRATIAADGDVLFEDLVIGGSNDRGLASIAENTHAKLVTGHSTADDRVEIWITAERTTGTDNVYAAFDLEALR